MFHIYYTTYSLGFVLTRTLSGFLLFRHDFRKQSTSLKGLMKTRSPLIAKIFFPTSIPAIYKKNSKKNHIFMYVCIYVVLYEPFHKIRFSHLITIKMVLYSFKKTNVFEIKISLHLDSSITEILSPSIMPPLLNLLSMWPFLSIHFHGSFQDLTLTTVKYELTFWTVSNPNYFRDIK